MKFWDTSAVVPLLVSDARSRALRAMAAEDPVIVVWWATEVECASAIARLEREGVLDERASNEAFDRLKQFGRIWQEVDASDPVREAAIRFLRVHPLRAADSLQLAAAYLAAERRPSSLQVVTLDERLAAAARKEGFMVVDVPGSE